MKNKINLMTKLYMVLVLTVLSTSFVLAFGVASPYWKDKPLKIYAGETEIVQLALQNMGGATEDITVRTKIIAGSEVASTEERDYIVKAGTKDTEVPVVITIPSDVPVDTNYKVTISFGTVTGGEEGGVAFGIGMDTTFDVLVVARPAPAEETGLLEKKSESKTLLAGIILVVLLIIIVIFIIRRKTKKVLLKE